MYSGIDRGGLPPVLLKQHLYSAAIRFKYGARLIAGPVIDDDYLDIPCLLAQRALNGTADEVTVVIVIYEDAYGCPMHGTSQVLRIACAGNDTHFTGILDLRDALPVQATGERTRMTSDLMANRPTAKVLLPEKGIRRRDRGRMAANRGKVKVPVLCAD